MEACFVVWTVGLEGIHEVWSHQRAKKGYEDPRFKTSEWFLYVVQSSSCLTDSSRDIIWRDGYPVHGDAQVVDSFTTWNGAR